MATFTFILRACPDAAKPAVAQLLGKAFSLKESTCASIAESAPIVLLPDLTPDEAAVMQVALAGFTRAGATVEFATHSPDELPKIDWPRRPQVFKRDITEHVADFQHPVMHNGNRTTLLAVLLATFAGGSIDQQSDKNRALTTSPVAAPLSRAPTEFRGIQLPEITPFGGVTALQPTAGPQRSATATVDRPVNGNGSAHGHDDAVSRLNELFPDEESSGFLPNNQDITSILNKLLPDEDGGLGSSVATTQTAASASGRRTAVGSLGSGGHQIISGHSVFLAKIADEGRRQKAVPLIAELGKITVDEAEILSKKVIIPVLKGATQAEAEAAKQKFAKIGILARVKGPE